MNFNKVAFPGLLQSYRLVKPIAQKEFSQTLLFIDEGRSPPIPCIVKQVAVKTPNFGFLQQQQVQKLEELGQHPQIPTLLAHFEGDEYLYLIHEFVDGVNLATVVEEEGTFNEAQIWQLLHDLLPVLKFIRDRQVIHRDIKPENIIRRSSDRRFVLVDFSSTRSSAEIDILKTDIGVGSPEFVAPEQAQGKAVFASDLYSLGVTCIYLLTGISPFDLFDIASNSWVWQQYLTNGVSDRLYKILDKLLQNAVIQRFSSVDEVLILTGRKVDMFKVENSNFQPATTAWQCTHSLNELSGLLKGINSVAMSRDDKLIVSGSDDNTIRLWNPSTGQVIGTLARHSQAVNCIAFNTRGNLLASASDDRSVKLWDYKTGREIYTFMGHSHAVKSVAFSPNGILASGSWDKTIKLWDVNTGVELWTVKGHKLQVSAIAFSPDGKFLASASFDRTVRLYSLYASDSLELFPQLRYILEGHDRHVLSVAFSPDGIIIATASDDNTVKLWDLNTGQARLTLLGHSWSVVAIAFTPDAETLVSGSWDKTVKLWKVSTGEHICTLCGHSDSVRAVSISSTGQAIASGSKDKTIKLWQVKSQALPMNATSGNLA